MDLVFKALKFASTKHQFQSRKGKSNPPFINHLIDVSYILQKYGEINDQDILAAAFLHDTIEDTDTSYEELNNQFNENIANMVLDLTDDKSLPANERKRQQILKATTLKANSRMIKLADKISNIKDITLDPPNNWSDERLLAYLHWAKDVVDQIRETNEKLENLFDEWYYKGLHHLNKFTQ